MKKRIAFVNNGFGPYFVPKFLELHRRLTADDYEMMVIEAARTRSLYDYLPLNKDVPEWWNRLSGQANLFRMFTAELQRLNPDVVFAGAVAYTAGAAAVRWGLAAGKPIVIMDNARRRNVSDNAVKNTVKKCFHTNADAAFLPSEAWCADYEWWGFETNRQFYGYNTLNNEPWFKKRDELDMDAAGIKKRNGLPEKFFLGVGRQIPAKNWYRVLEAYERLSDSQQAVEWGLVLVGEGVVRTELESFAQKHALEGVCFRDFQSPAKLAEYYSACSAFILPSINETWGFVVNECMCFEKPVLVSRLCGCSDDLVDNGKNGFVFDPHDVEKIADSMLKLIRSGEEDRAAMGTKSLEIITDWGMDRFEQGIRQAIAFCEGEQKRRGPVWTRLVLPFWKGRYNPI